MDAANRRKGYPSQACGLVVDDHKTRAAATAGSIAAWVRLRASTSDISASIATEIV